MKGIEGDFIDLEHLHRMINPDQKQLTRNIMSQHQISRNLPISNIVTEYLKNQKFKILCTLPTTVKDTTSSNQTRAWRTQLRTCKRQRTFTVTVQQGEDSHKGRRRNLHKEEGKDSCEALGAQSDEGDVDSIEAVLRNNFHQEENSKLPTSDPVGTEIDADVAAFIQRMMTTPQPVKHLSSMYNKTHRPSNVSSLGDIELKAEATDGRMVHAHNCMLKGITKVAYIMDTFYKNIDMIHSEMNPGSLMSHFNHAMRFFGAANFEMVQYREGSSLHHLHDPNVRPFTENISDDNSLFRERSGEIIKEPDVTRTIRYKQHGRQAIRSRYQPFPRSKEPQWLSKKMTLLR